MEVTRLRRNKAWELGKVFHWPGCFISSNLNNFTEHYCKPVWRKSRSLERRWMERKQRKQKLRNLFFFLHGPWCFISSNLKVLMSKQNAVILSLQTYFLFFELLQLVKISQNFHFFCPDSLIYKRFFEDFFHDHFLKRKYFRNNIVYKCFWAQNISLWHDRREIVKSRNYFCEIKYY